jgi:hypothetical protein
VTIVRQRHGKHIPVVPGTGAAIEGMVFSVWSEMDKPVSQSWQLAGMQTVCL